MISISPKSCMMIYRRFIVVTPRGRYEKPTHTSVKLSRPSYHYYHHRAFEFVSSCTSPCTSAHRAPSRLRPFKRELCSTHGTSIRVLCSFQEAFSVKHVLAFLDPDHVTGAIVQADGTFFLALFMGM